MTTMLVENISIQVPTPGQMDMGFWIAAASAIHGKEVGYALTRTFQPAYNGLAISRMSEWSCAFDRFAVNYGAHAARMARYLAAEGLDRCRRLGDVREISNTIADAAERWAATEEVPVVATMFAIRMVCEFHAAQL